MTLNKLASLIAKQEAKKSQASIGDIREILKIFFDLMNCDEHGDEVCDLMNAEKTKRMKRKK